MNHTQAHLTESGTHTRKLPDIQSQPVLNTKAGNNANTTNTDHTRNQQQDEQSIFYKKVGTVMRNYDRVLLFGPTKAKTELLNIVRADHRFDKIGIDVEETDSMTSSEQKRFVQNYFSK